MSRLPAYSAGQTSNEVSDAKAQPPGYIEAAESSTGHASGEVYMDKFQQTLATAAKTASRTDPSYTHMTVHSTQTHNFVLLSDDGVAVYYVDNTSSLSKTIIRSGNSTSSPVVSRSQPAGPFIKEMTTEYHSRVISKVSSTSISASGRFTIIWSFTIKGIAYEWKSHKGVWTLRRDQSVVATYDVGRTFEIKPAVVEFSDIVVSTVFAIDLYTRLTAERRVRALNSVNGKNSRATLGPGLLL